MLGMEGLKVSDANLNVYLHPSKSQRISDGILRELSSLLFKFNEVFDGVVLAYNVEAVDELAKILPRLHPYFGVNLKAKLLLFSPKPNMLLEGEVVKLKEESIHVIVLGFASAVINREDIREEFRYKTKNGKEVYRNRNQKHHSIKVGTVIRFMVKSMDEETLHISGSLLTDHTGSVSWLDKNSAESPISNRSCIESENREKQSTEEFKQHKKSKKRKVAMDLEGF